MSALPPKADIRWLRRNVRFVPIADIPWCKYCVRFVAESGQKRLGRNIPLRVEIGYGCGVVAIGEMGCVRLQSSSFRPAMSALGHKRTSGIVKAMSALPPKADMG
jgi:hypothetical protein